MEVSTFSIILPTYNRRDLLVRAVDSVLNQKCTDWELIIIDDGSTDNTKKYVDQIEDGRIQYHYQKNNGESSARNLGIKKSNGKYICFLDSDDELLEGYLEMFLYYLVSTTKIYCCGLRLQWEDRNKKIEIIPSENSKIFIQQALTGNFNLMPFCFDRKIVTSFEENIEMGEDFLFIVPLISEYKTTIIDSINCIVYEHQNRFTRSKYEVPRILEFKNSSLNIIEQNRSKLEKTFSSIELNNIIRDKLVNYILGISQHSYVNAINIWNENKNEYNLKPMRSRLILNKIKYIFKKLIVR